MTHRLVVQILVAAVAAVFMLGIYLSGDTIKAEWLRFFSPAVLVVTVGWSLWENLLWRWPLLQRLKGVPRNVGGTWKGVLTSLWRDEAGVAVPPKDAYLVVRQTANTVKVTMFTDEMTSQSSLGKVSAEDRQPSLDYLYLSKPDPGVENRSRMHHGSTSLAISGRPAKRLRGRYWTDRESRGDLDFRQHRRRHADDFESAEALFAEAS